MYCGFCDASERSEWSAAGLFGNSRARRSRRPGITVACPATVTADVRRQIRRMIGEFLREAGVLVGVLAPLEWLVTHGTLTVSGIIAIVVVAGPCLLLGVVLGLER